MFPIVVIPCLNEAAALDGTIGSLGFVPGGDCHGAGLVLVDNGSTDGTRGIMDAIASRLSRGSVAVVTEPERGFVPARRAGVEAAASLAARCGVHEDDVLVIQADADTRYAPGYCAAMATAARSHGSGHLYEARNEPPGDEGDECAGLNALAADVDASLRPLFGDPRHDVVVDDKVAAYALGDYRLWGGHVREFGPDGDETLAETTRLFIRARLRGGRRVTVEDASAVTSQRRVLVDPALAFATAGFPRGSRWVAEWRARYRGPHGLAGFHPPASRPELADAVLERARHVVGLFGVLPALIAAALGEEPADGLAARYVGSARRVGMPDVVRTSPPSTLLEAALAMPAREVGELIDRLARPHVHR